MTRPLTLILLILGCLLASGCLEVENVWTLNPDGSGKVKHSVVLRPGMLAALSPQSSRAFAQELLQESEGIEAWADFSYRKSDEGWLCFEGVGYFPDAAQVRLKHEVVQTRFARAGTAIVASFVGWRSQGDSLPFFGGETPKSLQEARTALLVARVQLGTMKAFLRGKDLLQLPGRVSSLAGPLEGPAEVAFSGERLSQFLGKLAQDDELLAAAIAQSAGQPLEPAQARALEQAMSEAYVGAGVAGLRSEGGQPAFDYAAEVAAAISAGREAYAEVGFARPGRPGLPLQNLRLVAIEHVWEESADHVLLDTFEPHVSMTWTASLGEKPLRVLGGRMTEARATDGSSLLLNEGPALEDLDARADLELGIRFSIQTRPARSVARLSGYIDYLLPGPVERKRELAFAAFQRDARAEGGRARLSEVSLEPGGILDLSLALPGVPEGQVAAVELVLGAEVIRGELQGSEELEAGEGPEERSGEDADEPGHALSLRFPGLRALPAKARFRLALYGAPTRHRLRFEMTRVDLSEQGR